MASKLCIGRKFSLASALGYSIPKKFLNISNNTKTGITTVLMKKAPVNSMTLEFLSELSETFGELEQEKPKGVIITSNCNKVFSAGLDFYELYKPKRERLKIFWTTLQDVMMNLYGSSYPTVAVINGHAAAGGCLLAICCEYRIMVDHFTIGLNETKVGLPVPPWLCLAMQNIIGKRCAEVSLTTAKMYKTNEALKIGLIDENAGDEKEAMNKAANFLECYETISSTARAKTKKYMRSDIEVMRKIRKTDVENYVSLLTESEVQQSIENYIASIKK